MKAPVSMKDMKIWAMLLILAGMAGTSCDNILEEEEMDCSVTYQVKFKYDYNMKYADAFAQEVGSVTLYAFDQDGTLVYQKTEEGAPLKAEGYSMSVDLTPGDYQLLTWAGLSSEASFSVPLVTPGVSTIEELKCKMDRVYSRSAEGTATINSRLTGLWHGQVSEASFTERVNSRAPQVQTVTVPLVKDINTLRIILQQAKGEPLDVENFEFTIVDDNGYMDYDNSLLDDEELTYYPYHRESGSVDVDSRTGEAGNVSVAIAQLTVGRLVVNQNPILTVSNKKTGELVLQIPLIKYLLLTEAEGHDMTPQEYLDRQDEYSMTFFLDEDSHWISSSIQINGWKIVNDNVGMQ